MKVIFLFLIFSFFNYPIQSDNLYDSPFQFEIKESATLKTVSHDIWHIKSSSIIKRFEISLFDSQTGLESMYDCSQEIIDIATDILEDRPNGSEVFVMIFSGTVVDLDICHEHDGDVIECGDPL